jgi:hypothetical protein
MSTQYDEYGEKVVREEYHSGPTVGGYAIESGAEQLGLFKNGRKKTVNVRGYTVEAHKRKARESGNADYGLGVAMNAAKAAQTKTVLAGVTPRASYTWIPWTIGILALAYWFAKPERG